MSDLTLNWVVDQWASAFVSVMETMTGAKPSVAVSAADLVDIESIGSGSWSRQNFSLAPDAAIWLYVPDNTWSGIGTIVTNASGLEQSSEESLRDTWSEVISQSFAALSSELSQKFGKEVLPTDASGCAKPEHAAAVRVLDIHVDATRSVRLAVVLSDTISAGISDEELDTQQKGQRSSSHTKVSDLNLVYEVELALAVSFGRTYLPLRDVMKLTTGSIVELDRLITEPVDIIVNNCVVARGEVVAIDGNYGVKVTSVVDRNDRLTLRNPGRPFPSYEEFRLPSRT